MNLPLALPAPNPYRDRLHSLKMKDQKILESAPKAEWKISFNWSDRRKKMRLHMVSVVWELWDNENLCEQHILSNCLILHFSKTAALRQAVAWARKKSPELYDAKVIMKHVNTVTSAYP